MKSPHALSAAVLVAFAASLAACEEEKKKEETAAATAAATPAPAPTPEKAPEPPKEVEPKEEKAEEETPIKKCCTALSRGAFTIQGADRRFYMGAAEKCREAQDKDQELSAAMPAIKKAMGSAKLPPDCL